MRTIQKILVLGLVLGIGLIPAKAQKSIALADSNSAMYSLANGTANIMPHPGEASSRRCSSSGSPMRSISGNAATGSSLLLRGPRTSVDAGRETISARAPDPGHGGKAAPRVPELASMIMFGSGLMLLGGVLRRRNAMPDQTRRNSTWAAMPLNADTAVPDSIAGLVRNG
jgi:hypothetical protein